MQEEQAKQKEEEIERLQQDAYKQPLELEDREKDWKGWFFIFVTVLNLFIIAWCETARMMEAEQREKAINQQQQEIAQTRQQDKKRKRRDVKERETRVKQTEDIVRTPNNRSNNITKKQLRRRQQKK